MTKINKKCRLTCFFCKYEISKHNKSNKTVLYAKKYRPICKYCTKNRHKSLNKEYVNTDTQCKLCIKPTLYKKCIACSICNHFYHGKCLDLNKSDIDKIENVCGFFICKNCNQDIFPKQIIDDPPKLKSAPKSNNCFTCCNKIGKLQYPNKHLLYDNTSRCLCENCSILALDIPVRDKTLIEFQDCSICKKLVRYESIFCNLCQHLVHPYCNGIDKKELNLLGMTEEDWFCLNCNMKIYPNLLLNDITKPNFTKKHHADIFQEFITYDDCSVCCKKVSGNETLSCSTCRHWVHKNCIGKFKNRIDYQNFLQYYSTKQWDCPACLAKMLPFIFVDNNDFLMLLLDIFSKATFLNKDNFQEVYNNLNSNDFFSIDSDSNNDSDSTQDKHLNNIDPDINYTNNDTCNYIINTEHISVKSTDELIIMNFNIRSIKKNFSNFEQLLCGFTHKIHIICLTESWLGELDNIEDFKLDGYHTPYFQNRPNDLFGGGVITYIHKDIDKHKLVTNLSFSDEFNNCLAVEITLNNKTTTFLNIYRSPNNNNDIFIKKLENTIEKLNTRTCYAIGDMNYNLINHNKHSPTKTYYDIFSTASFKPLITKPTRITDTSATLIDHIWTNDLRNTSINKSHIILTDITDHLPCITVVKKSDFHIKGYKTITKRLINDANRQKFTENITKIKDILSFQANNKSEPSLEERYNNYFEQISQVYNDCFPLKTNKVHSKTLNKPWITPKIQKMINKKNKMFSQKTKHNTDSNKVKYKIIKKEVEKEIAKEKEIYYKNLLEKTNNNIKQKWNAIRTIINRNKVQNSHCIIPNNILGKHYATVAEKLADKLPKMTQDQIATTSTSNNTPQANKTLFSFNYITERQVYELILKLDSNKGPGTDKLDIKSLKSIANVISIHLASLFNQSITLGFYPQILKIAKCVPIYKGSPLDPSDPANYRPISILTAINKIFE